MLLGGRCKDRIGQTLAPLNRFSIGINPGPQLGNNRRPTFLIQQAVLSRAIHCRAVTALFRMGLSTPLSVFSA